MTLPPSSSAKSISMADYRLSPKAQRDLDAIFDYTLKQWGLPQALRYTDLIEAACVSLAEDPQQSQDCAAIRPGYRRRNVELHAVYFQQTPYGVAIIRILHQRMDPARHF